MPRKGEALPVTNARGSVALVQGGNQRSRQEEIVRFAKRLQERGMELKTDSPALAEALGLPALPEGKLLAGCQAAVEALQGAMPGVEIDDYACLNLQGISEGEEMDEQRLRERVSALRAEVETASSAEIQTLYKQMEPYITTNMKSGAMMKFLDKADRYERSESVHLDEQDEAAMNRLLADVFYERAE